MNNNSDSTGRTEGASKSLSANSSPGKKISLVSEPRPPHFHSQTQNPGCHPEIIVSTDAPMPIHFFAEGEPKNSASNLAFQPEIITAEAPVHPHYMDLDEDGRQNGNNDERRDSSSKRSKKHFNIVLPSSTTRPIVSSDSNPPAESTTDIPFYAVEATAIIPETVYEADIVADDEHKDIQVTQNQLCPRTRKHQLIIVAVLVLVLCIMSAVIGALTASKSSNEDDHIAITNTSTTASTVTTSRPLPTLSTTEPPKRTTTEATQTINLAGYRLAVNVNYAISSTCNANATDVLNENRNTIKRGLIEATEKWTIRILNETFPRARRRRRLVYYSPMHPVSITYVEDIDESKWCSLGSFEHCCKPETTNCMEVMSIIYLTFDKGDDAKYVEEVILNGFTVRFKDRSFFEAIPPDTIFCPSNRAPAPPTPASPALPHPI